MWVPELYPFSKKALFPFPSNAWRWQIAVRPVLSYKPARYIFSFAWQYQASRECRWNQLKTKLIKHFCWLRLKCPNRKGVRAHWGFELRSNEGASQFHLKHLRGKSFENFINITSSALKCIYSINWEKMVGFPSTYVCFHTE